MVVVVVVVVYASDDDEAGAFFRFQKLLKFFYLPTPSKLEKPFHHKRKDKTESL